MHNVVIPVKPVLIKTISIITIKRFRKMLIKMINKMLYYDIIDVLEGINVIKTNASKGCIICYYQNVKTIS